jgi:hypothetical protein
LPTNMVSIKILRDMNKIPTEAGPLVWLRAFCLLILERAQSVMQLTEFAQLVINLAVSSVASITII